MDISIRQGTMKEALSVLKQLPEFDRLLEDAYYSEKIKGKKHLILVALDGKDIVGCKVGYDRFKDDSFYSWLGGVLTSHRKKGIAKKLSISQERWVKEEGFESIKFKTLNRHKAMLHFSLQNGFDIYNVKPKDELENYRIELIKHID